MKLAILLLLGGLTACSQPSPEIVKAIAETCAKQNMVADYDGPTGSVRCVRVKP